VDCFISTRLTSRVAHEHQVKEIFYTLQGRRKATLAARRFAALPDVTHRAGAGPRHRRICKFCGHRLCGTDGTLGE
jgi:hypothetical protein